MSGNVISNGKEHGNYYGVVWFGTSVSVGVESRLTIEISGVRKALRTHTC